MIVRNIKVLKLLELLSDSCDLFHAILMRREIRFKGLMFFLQSLELIQLTLSEVLRRQHLLFTGGPLLMSICLVLEFLCQMFQSL